MKSAELDGISDYKRTHLYFIIIQSDARLYMQSCNVRILLDAHCRLSSECQLVFVSLHVYITSVVFLLCCDDLFCVSGLSEGVRPTDW